MATLTAKLTLSSSNLTSDSLNIVVSDTLSISKAVEIKRITTSGTAAAIVTASAYTKAWVYVKNMDTAIAMTLVKAEGGDVFMDLGPGEFAFFPWSTLIDLFVDAASGTPTLELAIFEV
jgi:hypothetical protein|tara:strand:+ start:471 stop:827 length:357 start_codon:yes stop_codon:yes gene_type:complete